jgi:hypothetical protein
VSYFLVRFIFLAKEARKRMPLPSASFRINNNNFFKSVHQFYPRHPRSKRRVPNQKINIMSKEVKSVEYGLEKYLKEHKISSALGTDYVEFYVGNAKQSAHYYKTAFGYQSLRMPD